LPFVSLLVVYLAYRVWLGPLVLHLPDNKDGQQDYTLAHQLLFWPRALQIIGPLAWEEAASGAARLSLWLGIAALAVALLRRRHIALRTGYHAVGLGLVGLIAGYAPLSLTTNDPSVVGVATRVNAAATLGAALLACAMLWLLAAVVPRTAWRPGLYPLLLLLAVVTAAGHEQRGLAARATAWQQQQTFWHALRRALPGLRPGTILVVVPTSAQAAAVLADVRSWGLAQGLALLYPRLGVAAASVILPDEPMDLCTAPAGSVLVLRLASPDSILVERGPIVLPNGLRVVSHANRIRHGPPVAASSWQAVLR
jgi:hypothetical protein